MKIEGLPTEATMTWNHEHDKHDNTVWVLDSPVHDDGDPFKFRLRPQLQDDRVVWIDDSDRELTDPGYVYDDLAEGVEAMEKAWRTAAHEYAT